MKKYLILLACFLLLSFRFHPEVVDIVLVLDKSGSMTDLQDETIINVNNFIDKQKCLEGDVNFTFVLFDHTYDMVCDNMDLQSVENINKQIYHPDGNTALLDAIGKTIKKIDSRCEKPNKLMFVILTDGLENSSTEYSKRKLSKMIEDKQCEDKWEFLFLGANFDAFEEGGSMGIVSGNSHSFIGSAAGIDDAFNTINCSATSFRGYAFDTLKAITDTLYLITK